VLFGNAPAAFTVSTDGYLTATIPSGATTAPITVTTATATLKTPRSFRVLPQITSFNPSNGPVGTSVQITGISLAQANKVTFDGVAATAFTVNSDTQVTATVPTGAKTGKTIILTPGGTATSAATFTVTP
jgi:large repetitive protein